jgi:hypothetical protein
LPVATDDVKAGGVGGLRGKFLSMRQQISASHNPSLFDIHNHNNSCTYALKDVGLSITNPQLLNPVS